MRTAIIYNTSGYYVDENGNEVKPSDSELFNDLITSNLTGAKRKYLYCEQSNIIQRISAKSKKQVLQIAEEKFYNEWQANILMFIK